MVPSGDQQTSFTSEHTQRERKRSIYSLSKEWNKKKMSSSVSSFLLFIFAFSLAPLLLRPRARLLFYFLFLLRNISSFLSLSMHLTPALFCLLFHETICRRRSNLSGDPEGLQQRDSFPHLHHLVHRKQSFRIPLHIMNTSTLNCAEIRLA